MDLLEEAKAAYTRALDADRDNRARAEEDLAFYTGEQWPEAARKLRAERGRPVLTFNRLPAFIKSVANQARLNPPAIRVQPVDDGSDPDTAEVLEGVIRHIEQGADAPRIYAAALEQAAICGQGHWRVTTEWSDTEGFAQELGLKRIASPFAVLWDPDAEAPDRSDADWCFVLQRLTLAEFERRFPDASPEGFAQPERLGPLAGWLEGDRVTVAEYWRRRHETRQLYSLADGRIVDEKPADGTAIRASRPVSVPVVEQILLSPAEILAGPQRWPGRIIPIVTVTGEEVSAGGTRFRHGMVRFARDAQRLYNYARSAAAESLSQSPKAPYLVTPNQIRDHERLWARAGQDLLPYLPYNPDPQAPRPTREPPPPVPSAFYQEAATAADDMKAITGIHDAALGARSNESSARAILARKEQADLGSFAYIDNLAAAVAKTGRILVETVPHIYGGARLVRLLGEDGRPQFRALGGYAPRDAAAVLPGPDLARGKYDVVVKSGPSFASRREKAQEMLMQFVQTMPGSASLVADLIASTLDLEEARPLAERLRAALEADRPEVFRQEKDKGVAAPPP